jgi:Domain of unknown function (DUF4349)
MRWSDKSDDDKLRSLLSGEGEGRLGSALLELQQNAPAAPTELRQRVRLLAAEEPAIEKRPRPALTRRFSLARVGAAVAAILVVAVAVPAIAAFTRDRGSSDAGDAATSAPTFGGGGGGGSQRRSSPPTPPPDAVPGAHLRSALAPPASPPPPGAEGGSIPDFAAPKASEAAPGPSASRAQDYSANIKLHVKNPDELSEAVQSAIRSTRQLGGYVTYVDYGTSGAKDGDAELSVRVPVGRVQTAIARFSALGTILEQQTEIRDLQGRIDRITRDVQRRRDRIAKLEAELKDPTLSDGARNRLEARIVQAKRGLANALRGRSGVIRQSRFAKLDLAFTTKKREEPAPPPSELRRTLDDAAGILAAEVGVLIYIVVAGAPFIALALIAFFGARALRRGANARVLERA